MANAFQQFLSNNMEWLSRVDGLSFGTLNSEEAGLEIPFRKKEIHVALMDMNGDKAPSPDGFTMAFWQDSWDVVKEDVLRVLKEFFEHGTFIRSLNTIFLVLIPKKDGVEDLGEFRPIRQVGSLYKLLAKVLANKRKKVVGKVVSKA